MAAILALSEMFQHTAARRRLVGTLPVSSTVSTVSTHSRPKAAVVNIETIKPNIDVSTHSRPKAAGEKLLNSNNPFYVSTHSRPKAAAFFAK